MSWKVVLRMNLVAIQAEPSIYAPMHSVLAPSNELLKMRSAWRISGLSPFLSIKNTMYCITQKEKYIVLADCFVYVVAGCIIIGGILLACCC